VEELELTGERIYEDGWSTVPGCSGGGPLERILAVLTFGSTVRCSGGWVRYDGGTAPVLECCAVEH